MSYENVPKNVTEKAVLQRQGRPDFSKLDADAFPVPATAEEQGAILEVTDTGDRYRWTGSVWIQIGTTGSIHTFPLEFYAEVAKGNIPGHAVRAFVQQNPNIAAVEEDVWGAGGTLAYPAAAESWEVLSSSAADTLAGVGARTILINYLDDSYVQQFKIVNLNGVTPVALNADHFRPDGAVIIASDPAGAGTNTGTITIRVAGGGATRQIIAPGFSASEDTHFTVPAGKTYFGIFLRGFFAKNDDGTFGGLVRPFGTSTWIRTGNFPFYQNNIDIEFKALFPLLEKTDGRFTASSNSGGSEVNLVFEVLIVDN